MSDFRLYKSDEIFNLDMDIDKPIIEGLLYERDNVLLLAKDKVGKSILAQHIGFCISSGESFLDLKVYKHPCLFCQFEGKKGETVKRWKNMKEGVECSTENLTLLYHFGITLNTGEGLKTFIEIIDKGIKTGVMKVPKVIIIDNLYMAFKGKLCDDEEGSNFCRNIRLVADRYNSSIILIHHEHRAKRGIKGDIIVEGDESIYGSFIWRAFPEHILLLSNMQGKGKVLTCNTQRSGSIIEKIELDFIEPVPLMFEKKADVSHYIRVVEDTIVARAMSMADLQDITKLPTNTIRAAIVRLLQLRRIEKIVKDGSPIMWKKV